MTIAYPEARPSIEGHDLAQKVSFFESQGPKDRDFGLPLQLIDCGGLILFGGRLDLPMAAGRARFSFDFATDGPAAVGAFVLGRVPKGLIVKGGYLDVITSVAGGTIALGIETTADLFAAATPAAGIVDIVPQAETPGGYVKATAEKNLVMTVATGALTAGKFHMFLDCDLSE